MRYLAHWTLVVSLFGTPGWALAQVAAPAPEAVAGARAAFLEGRTAADEERHEEAIDAFRRSIAIVERDSSYRNLGLELQVVGRFVEARDAFARCAELATLDERREACLRRQAEVQEEIAHLRVRLTPASAVVEVDGRTVDGMGGERTVDVDAGRRRLSVSALQHSPWSEVFELSGGETRELVVALEPNAPAVRPSTGTVSTGTVSTGTAAPSAESSSGAGADLAPVGVATLIAGTAVAAAGAVVLALGYVALGNVNGFSAGDRWNDALEADYVNAPILTGVGWAALPVGVLAAGAGALLLTLSASEDVEVVVGPGGVFAQGSF